MINVAIGKSRRDCKEETVENEVEFSFIHVKFEEEEKISSSAIHRELEIQG